MYTKSFNFKYKKKYQALTNCDEYKYYTVT